MKWSPKQARAVDSIARWIADPGDQQTFYLAGHAGTGKTEILRHIAAGVKGTVLFGAFTGRAASVMERKGCRGAQTIHSMIYVPLGGERPTHDDAKKLRDQIQLYRRMKEPASAQHLADSLEHQLRRIEEDLERGAGPRFALNPGSDLARAKLCIVDECSFLDRKMGEDLESFGTPILYVGDPAQLPPVFGEGYITSRQPDAYLDEIHRQALDSPVLYLADLARRGEPLPYGKHGDSEVLRAGDASLADRALAADMVIVGRNRTRHASNHKIRRLRGRGVTPEVGERAICLRNDHELGLLNGTQWMIDRCLADLDRMTARIAVTPVDEGGGSVECDTWLHHFFAREEELVNVHDRRTKQEFDYGYAITCHKCVALDTLVETPRGLERIDEIAESGTIATHEGVRPYVDGTIYPETALLRVVTRCGYTLDVTPNHGMFAWDPAQGYTRVEASELREGQVLQFLLEPVCNPESLASLPNPPAQDVRARIYGLPSRVTGAVAEWLGLMVGDGTVFHSGLRLAKRHLDVVERFDSLCRALFEVVPKRGTTLGTEHVEVFSTQIAQWCERIGGLSPNQKAVPHAIRCSPLEVQARFLRGLFEDGTVNLNRDGKLDHVEWSTCQEGMAREVQTMLLRFGVISSRVVRDQQWMIYIYGANAHRFRDRIGFVSSFKNQRLLAPVGPERNYRVPLMLDEVTALRSRLSVYEYQNARATGYVSREKAKCLLEVELIRDRMRFLHDEVVRVVRLPDAKCACVMVPSLGRFLQNGSPQANSQGGQWDSVMVFDESQSFKRDAHRWRYTALTRAAERVEVVQ